MSHAEAIILFMSNSSPAKKMPLDSQKHYAEN